jgi:hypothetical protein
MEPSRERYYRVLFLVAMLYDGLLGIAFILFYKPIFDVLDVAPPEGGYIPLLGSFLFVIGVAYYLIWRSDLERNRDMILVGTLYKLAYSAVALTYWAIGEVPHVAFAAVFGIADLIFFVLMLDCWLYLGRRRS